MWKVQRDLYVSHGLSGYIPPFYCDAITYAFCYGNHFEQKKPKGSIELYGRLGGTNRG